MKITPLQHMLCRTPAFGLNQTLTEVWEELKPKIEESSTAFYQMIKSLKVDELDQLDNKAKFTIWKYFNRAQYRATPFGTFANISKLDLLFSATPPISLSKDTINYNYIDWSHKEKYEAIDVTRAVAVLSNASVYFVVKEIRYLKINNGTFELAAVSTLPELNAILLFCKRKTKMEDVYDFMEYAFNMDKKNTIDLLQQMVSLQLLHTNLQANIIGEDFFTRLGIPCTVKADNYIISERKLIHRGFDARKLKYFPEMISFFTKQLEAYEYPDLLQFKIEYMKRFEGQEISLMQAMDPEIGIGYGNYAQLDDDQSLVNDIKMANVKKRQKNITYGKLEEFVLKALVKNEPLDLADFNSDTEVKSVLPNTFSLLFHLYNGQPVITHGGGCTANTLLGRFTLANPEIETFGKTIANKEIAANPGVLFFDIAYQVEDKVDNVNRRKQLYPYELPILTWSEMDEPIMLNDIIVAVEHNEVILKSKKLNKRLIPRISSAYNYTRSDLSVYRFLCDIQGQGLLMNLTLKIEDIFPNLEYYPRVSYKGVVLSGAMWLIPKDAYQNEDYLKEWLLKKQINFMIKAGKGDQTLTFNPLAEKDIWALFNYCKQQSSSIYITEALLKESDGIRDENGNTYFPQYVVNYHHQNQIYLPSSPQHKQAKEVCLPGSQWLYFQIYCHPSKSNLILTNLIKPFLKLNKIYFKKWFFIRFADPKPHIRLRLHLKKEQYALHLIQSLRQYIEPDLKNGFVSDFQIKTYDKETQRYGAEQMGLTEKYFHLDSEAAMRVLNVYLTANQLLVAAINGLEQILALAWNVNESLAFLELMSDSFTEEMNIDSTHFRKINASFKLLDSQSNSFNSSAIPLTLQQQRVLTLLLAKTKEEAAKTKLIASLIHMHVNRLFIENQRIYETIIYHYLLKNLQAKLAISKASKEC